MESDPETPLRLTNSLSDSQSQPVLGSLTPVGVTDEPYDPVPGLGPCNKRKREAEGETPTANVEGVQRRRKAAII